jgi:excinuclease UvrABC helicase subunit UvrB
MESFDELFNKFFGKRLKKDDTNTNDELKKMFKLIDNIGEFDTIDEDNIGEFDTIDEAFEQEIEKTLGKPYKIEFYNEGNTFYEKRIWHTSIGDMVKLIITTDPSLLGRPYMKPIEEEKKDEKSLKEQMKKAIEEEKYELAGELRDEINKLENKEPKKKVRKTKKK